MALIYWSLAILTRLFSLPAICVVPPAGILFIHSTFFPESPLHFLLLTLFSLLLSDWLLGAVFWPHLKICRMLPHHAQAGRPFTLSYKLENRRRLPALHLTCDLPLGLRWFKMNYEARCSYLGSRQTTVLQTELIPYRRGIFILPSLVVSSSFPFNICRHSSTCHSDDELIVHPAYHILKSLNLPPGRRISRDGHDIPVIRFQESDDFQGCRDYRDGDNPRHIHWQSSARRGALVVKEFHDRRQQRTILVLDSFIPWPGTIASFTQNFRLPHAGWMTGEGYDETLEAAVALAASACDYLIRHDFHIDFYTSEESPRHLSLGTEDAPLTALLDILAGLRREYNPGFKKLPEAVYPELPHQTNAIVILTGLDQPRRDFLQSLRDCGLTPKTLLISRAKAEIPPDITRLTPADILNGKLTAF